MMRKTSSVLLLPFLFLLLSLPAPAQPALERTQKLFEAADYAQARASMAPVLAQHPDHPEARYWMGRVLLRLAEFDQATDHLEAAVKAEPANVDYRLALATAYRERARRSSFLSAARWASKWRRELEKAFELDPKNLKARERLIQYYLNAPAIGGGDKEKGKRLARETIELDEIQGRLLLASAYRSAQEIEQAIAEYQRVIKLDPANGPAHNALGYIYLRQKNYAAAESYFKKYVDVAPGDPNPHDSLGDYYSARGRLDQAMAEFEKALEVNPRFSVSRFKLAQVCEKQRRHEEAIHHYETLLALAPAFIKAKEARKRLRNLKQ
jgi:tetratricopeptide (TPR) repeat protein